jgi:heptosyltransferase-2
MASPPMQSAPDLSSERGTRNAERGTLVIQTAFLGDVVLTLPLVQRLAEQSGPVDLLVTPTAVPLVARQPSVREAIPYDKRGVDRGLAGLQRVARSLRTRQYARAFLPHRSLRSALLARLSGIPERTGFWGGLPGWLHTRRVRRPATGHESRRLSALAGWNGPTVAPWLQLTREDRRTAGAWLDAHGVGPEYLVLAPGARWATKRWPAFAGLAAELALRVVVIGGPEDGAVAQEVVQAAGSRAQSAAGDLTLTESAALIERAALVVSNDSVAAHLAVSLARPVLVIAGPTGPVSGFEPLSPSDIIVAHPDLPCRPCSRHGHDRCPLGHHRCMRELTVERVRAAVMSRLGR